MIESMFGGIHMEEDDVGYTVKLEFNSMFDDEPTYLATIDERNLDRMIYHLEKIRDNFKKIKERRQKIRETVDFRKIYWEMDRKYNPYPVQMTDAEAFGHALSDGIIDKETYIVARERSGRLWNYTGD